MLKINHFAAVASSPWPEDGRRRACPNFVACLFCPRGKNSLEMWALLFPRHHPDINIFETGLFQKIVELHFAEAEPMIEIKLAGFLKLMAE
jgi:hypothetical protein